MIIVMVNKIKLKYTTKYQKYIPKIVRSKLGMKFLTLQMIIR